jgi:hypothetical protein
MATNSYVVRCDEEPIAFVPAIQGRISNRVMLESLKRNIWVVEAATGRKLSYEVSNRSEHKSLPCLADWVSLQPTPNRGKA